MGVDVGSNIWSVPRGRNGGSGVAMSAGGIPGSVGPGGISAGLAASGVAGLTTGGDNGGRGMAGNGRDPLLSDMPKSAGRGCLGVAVGGPWMKLGSTSYQGA